MSNTKSPSETDQQERPSASVTTSGGTKIDEDVSKPWLLTEQGLAGKLHTSAR